MQYFHVHGLIKSSRNTPYRVAKIIFRAAGINVASFHWRRRLASLNTSWAEIV